jgi:Uma2 family endonuclease
MNVPMEANLQSLASVVHHLGDIAPQRIHLRPAGGPLTEADWLSLPDPKRFELVDGLLVEKAMGIYESRLSATLLAILEAFVQTKRLGFVLGEAAPCRLEGNLRMPDVAYFSWQRFPERRVPRVAVLDLAPDLAVEILSPSNTAAEMARKRDEYFRAGTRLVWEIEPQLQQVRVYSAAEVFTAFHAGDTLPGEPVLPGFSLLVQELFDRADGQV